MKQRLRVDLLVLTFDRLMTKSHLYLKIYE